MTGTAPYAAEFDVPNQGQAAIVRSTVASGRITTIDRAAAQRAPGVIAVVTHRNAPRLAYRPHEGVVDPDVGERLHVLQDDRVSHQGQPIALVIAETLEQAHHAASLVQIRYVDEAAITDVTRAKRVMPTQQQTDQGARRPPEIRPQYSRAACWVARQRSPTTK